MYGVVVSVYGNWVVLIVLMDCVILLRLSLVAVKSFAVSVVDLVGSGEFLML